MCQVFGLMSLLFEKKNVNYIPTKISTFPVHFFSDNKQRETVVTSFPVLSVGATVPPVSRIIPGLTTFECAAQCFQDRACVAFAISAALKEYHCALTNASARSGGSPEAVWGDSVTQWFCRGHLNSDCDTRLKIISCRRKGVVTLRSKSKTRNLCDFFAQL